MATRRRKRVGSHGHRRRVHARRHNPVNPVNPVNPTRRRRRSVRRHRRYGYHARRRNPVNPVHRRRHHRRYHRRRHNPVTGLLGRAVPLVIGSAAVGFATPFVSQFVVRFAPQIMSTPIGVAATTFGTGWGLSALARMFAFTRRWADDVLLAGAVLAGGQLFTAYVAPMIRLGGGGGGQGMGRGSRRWGLSGIGMMTNIPPGYALPPAAQANARGMQGMGVRPTGAY